MLKKTLIGLFAGLMFAALIPPNSIDPKMLTLALLIVLDSMLEGFRAELEHTFDDAQLMFGLLINLLLGALLAAIGLYMAAAIVFGLRIIDKVADFRVPLLNFFRRV